MAFSTSTVHKPYTKVGVPQVAADFDKFEKNATPKWAAGTKIETADGSVYRYCHFGDDVNRGVFVSQDLDESSKTDTDNAIIAPGSAVAAPDSNINVGAIGSRFVQITLGSTSAGQYAGGKFCPTDDTGIGFTYDIRSNTATDDPASGDIRIELHQKLQVAVAADTDFAIAGNLYANLEIATAATDIAVAGVTCSTMDVSAAAYGWVQTKGVVSVLQDATTVVIGDAVALSSATSGAVAVFGGSAASVGDIPDEEMVGTMLIVGGSGGHSVIKLNIGG